VIPYYKKRVTVHSCVGCENIHTMLCCWIRQDFLTPYTHLCMQGIAVGQECSLMCDNDNMMRVAAGGDIYIYISIYLYIYI